MNISISSFEGFTLLINIGLGWIIEHIEQNSLKNAHVRAERCEISRKILISNISKLYDKQALQFYFESKKKSGGGPVTSVQLLGNGGATVSFADCTGTVDSINIMIT